MLGANDRKMSSIQRRNGRGAQTLCCRHYRRIYGTKRKIVVCRDKFCDTDPVGRKDRFGEQISCREITQEPNFCRPAQPRLEKIRNFGYYELRDDERTFVRLEQCETRFVVAVVFIDVGVKRPGIDNQCYRRASRRMISSMRRAVSRRPLRPAFAAMSRRRLPPPRCASIASRVISAIVVPRREASCRSFASRSSGSLTVVRRMVCQHTMAGILFGEVGFLFD